MATLPTKHSTMEIIIINKILSERDSSGLADSRAQYQFDPVSLPARERCLIIFELMKESSIQQVIKI